jgi:hypothetical protein
MTSHALYKAVWLFVLVAMVVTAIYLVHLSRQTAEAQSITQPARVPNGHVHRIHRAIEEAGGEMNR